MLTAGAGHRLRRVRRSKFESRVRERLARLGVFRELVVASETSCGPVRDRVRRRKGVLAAVTGVLELAGCPFRVRECRGRAAANGEINRLSYREWRPLSDGLGLPARALRHRGGKRRPRRRQRRGLRRHHALGGHRALLPGKEIDEAAALALGKPGDRLRLPDASGPEQTRRLDGADLRHREEQLENLCSRGGLGRVGEDLHDLEPAFPQLQLQLRPRRPDLIRPCESVRPLLMEAGRAGWVRRTRVRSPPLAIVRIDARRGTECCRPRIVGKPGPTGNSSVGPGHTASCFARLVLRGTTRSAPARDRPRASSYPETVTVTSRLPSPGPVGAKALVVGSVQKALSRMSICHGLEPVTSACGPSEKNV
jgi:hypothetical protein